MEKLPPVYSLIFAVFSTLHRRKTYESPLASLVGPENIRVFWSGA